MFILVHDEVIIKLLQKLARRGESSSSDCLALFLLFQIESKVSEALLHMYNPEYILYYITVKSEQKLSIDIEFQAKHVLCVRNDKLLVRFH